jgi:hypothetical protein
MKLSYAHLPVWLENSFIFRKLFLIRKLFFTKKKFTHYSQSAEDISIARHFPKRAKGFFVDVGCYHPVKYNNTYRLYKKGWRGVNIDIDPIKIEGFNLLRPGDINLAYAVSDKKGEVTYWTNGFYSLVNTLEKGVTSDRSYYDYRPRKAQADTLADILDATKFKDTEIDLLTIDAEGHDLQVLQSLDFERYHPFLICVESLAATMEEIQDDPVYQYLIDRGYSMVNWVGLSIIFKRIEAR